jgi:hypothetical protein
MQEVYASTTIGKGKLEGRKTRKNYLRKGPLFYLFSLLTLT